MSSLEYLLDFAHPFLKLNKKPTFVECCNESEAMNKSLKTQMDNIAEAEFNIRNETDPLKRAKMESRLALGITDFSDL